MFYFACQMHIRTLLLHNKEEENYYRNKGSVACNYISEVQKRRSETVASQIKAAGGTHANARNCLKREAYFRIKDVWRRTGRLCVYILHEKLLARDAILIEPPSCRQDTCLHCTGLNGMGWSRYTFPIRKSRII